MREALRNSHSTFLVILFVEFIMLSLVKEKLFKKTFFRVQNVFLFGIGRLEKWDNFQKADI